ncbi:MAG TPA: ribosome silencing factor [Candidatus Marinimicrobia bacterium]|nr:ribosome silencing factor [Candidatus Neomarinimicrobiota bacterium]MDP6276027.1 ribosome silencing factor [Candidatus Neomarinimicrobiota bacterium]MDP7329918.1 ribosome silencing factor [Candidatus Neomarinimicrobiota bacterium]MDP7437737.1 ribosome silencing factor [Candidatus Neomarinimicrobiota bacterium]HJL73912.1 ribosome silencing factor [Candidatus Neomarinimicrobiota bacterium]
MTPTPSTPNNEASVLARGIANLALEKQAQRVISLDVRGITSITDHFVFCSADTDVQVKAIADNIRKGTDHKPWRIEGYEQLNWVLLDYVDVVVHIFRTIEREYYNLESLWSDATIKKYEDEPEETPSKTAD